MKDVARRQQISKKYGDQIGMNLTQAGILLTTRGRQGGYRLRADAGTLTVLQILTVMEGPMAPVQCLETDHNNCKRREYCATLSLWTGLNRVMTEYLGGITLQDLLEKMPEQPEFDDLPVPD